MSNENNQIVRTKQKGIEWETTGFELLTDTQNTSDCFNFYSFDVIFHKVLHVLFCFSSRNRLIFSIGVWYEWDWKKIENDLDVM